MLLIICTNCVAARRSAGDSACNTGNSGTDTGSNSDPGTGSNSNPGTGNNAAARRHTSNRNGEAQSGPRGQ